MVVSWLLNSIVPELADAFLYANSARELRDELIERFGQSNAPLLYQIQKEIEDLYQGNDNVAVYYTKLKKLWDELADLSEVSICDCVHNPSCTALRNNIELDQRQKLMQFLMHLNDSYDDIRGHILLLDPLPPVKKAYSMIQRVEKQRQVTHNSSMSREVASNVSRINHASKELEPGATSFFARNSSRGGRRDNSRRRDAKSALFCNHCQRNGHTRDKCFKLVGYPDWYEGPRDNTRTRKPVRLAATVQNTKAVMDTPLEETENSAMIVGQQHSIDVAGNNGNILQILAQEMMKLMKGNHSAEQTQVLLMPILLG
uniref:Uncharacterized protein n=1 Tax=Opuntia streptacantha TaxID=393608 RepID=A0A7C8Z8R5_OPUST